jgi:hypothetical protein
VFGHFAPSLPTPLLSLPAFIHPPLHTADLCATGSSSSRFRFHHLKAPSAQLSRSNCSLVCSVPGLGGRDGDEEKSASFMCDLSHMLSAHACTLACCAASVALPSSPRAPAINMSSSATPSLPQRWQLLSANVPLSQTSQADVPTGRSSHAVSFEFTAQASSGRNNTQPLCSLTCYNWVWAVG